VSHARPNPPTTRSAGKSTKGAGGTKIAPPMSRRDKLASFEAARKKEARNRTIRLLVICLVLALALLAYPVYLFVDDYRSRNADLASLGVDVAAAGCDQVAEAQASGNQDHVDVGTKVPYAEFPPAYGQHYAEPAAFDRKFYTMADRPPVEQLVHNLEHGYTIAWYRDGAPDSDVRALERIAKTFSGEDYNPEDKFIAAPWNESDGGAFPGDKNVVLTRWTADPNDPSDTTKQFGARQTCVSVSGQAVKDFMAKYPFANSPEPNGA
jgi:hypothetical protein